MPASPSMVVASDPCLEEREAKFLPDAVAAHAFWAIAARHLGPQSGAAPFAYTRTTYFDTPDLAYYRAMRATGRRLRVREYAVADTADEVPVGAARCYLELKQSGGGRRSKTRVVLRPDEVPAALAAIGDAPLAPYVATWYQRRALVDHAGSIRVTLDHQIRICRPRPLGSPFGRLGRDEVVADGPAFVLEYKARCAPPAWLDDALAGLEEAVGFSKFVLGMDAIIRPAASRPPRGERPHLQVA